MSPIIELQRRMVEAGRIRAGEKGDKGEPRKLDKWRLTSKDPQRIEDASVLWGGEPRQWKERAGEFEVYTETDALPIMLLPGHLPTTWYELWSKGGCQRRCDGVHEVMSDSACLCGEERECKPHTRLSVLLPDLPGIGSWMLSSTGWNAAAELAGAADLLQRASAQGVLIPARLRLEQRVQVTQGQTRRYAVPVIDIDIAFRDLLGGQGVLAAASEQPALSTGGYVPITGKGNGVSLADSLAAAETQELTRTSRSAAPIPKVNASFGETPVPVDTDSGAPASNPEGSLTAPRDKPLTKAQKDKLNVLVGTLRDAGRITTKQLYVKLAWMRQVEVDTLIDLTPDARDEEGVLHWAPLRETLVRDEASTLIDALERFEAEQAS